MSWSVGFKPGQKIGELDGLCWHIWPVTSIYYVKHFISLEKIQSSEPNAQTLPCPPIQGSITRENSLSKFPCDICCLFDSPQNGRHLMTPPQWHGQYDFFPEIKTLFLSIELIGQLQQRRGRDLWHGGLVSCWKSSTKTRRNPPIMWLFWKIFRSL